MANKFWPAGNNFVAARNELNYEYKLSLSLHSTCSSLVDIWLDRIAFGQKRERCCRQQQRQHQLQQLRREEIAAINAN